MPAFHFTFRILFLWSFVIMLMCCGCRQSTSSDPYPYTPNDFDNQLRDLLKKIEQHNIVYLDFSGCRGGGELTDASRKYFWDLQELASQKELLKISKCSNPVIRAYALQILIQDSTIDALPLVKAHIYDSAFVFDDYSYKKWTVLSLLLHTSYYWNSTADRKTLEKELLQKRPFEAATYGLLNEDKYIDTFPGFYEIVKKMAWNLGFNDFNKNVDWNEGKGAVDRLASYQYQGDIPLLYSLFEESLYYANGHFFPARSIQIFQTPAFEKYYLDTSINWQRQFKFLRIYDSNYEYQKGLYNFIDLVIGHKSIKSANLLEKIIKKSPFEIYGYREPKHIEIETRELNSYIAHEIRNINHPVYASIIILTEKYYNENDDYSYGKFGRDHSSSFYDPPTKQPDEKPFRAFWWE